MYNELSKALLLQTLKNGFALRLRAAMAKQTNLHGPTDLARFISAHSRLTISAQTAHKWLSSRAIPREANLKQLARCLGVSEHWLKYGEPDQHSERHLLDRGAALDLESPLEPNTDWLQSTLANKQFCLSAQHKRFLGQLLTHHQLPSKPV